MPRAKRWIIKPIKDGVMEVDLTSWKYLYDFVRQEMLDYSHYVWRGQRDAAWSLASSFDRAMTFKPKSSYATLAKRHLNSFKLASRGRRGANPSTPGSDDDWWALAQHHGMATPLLDWTESPFAAMYFAFDKEQAPSSDKRAIWALNAVNSKNKSITDAHVGRDPPILRFIRPMQDENARLVSQSGLFTRAPYGDTVDSWITSNFKGHVAGAPLVKISVPNRERPDCLRTLTKMNINHLSLFPDLYGAGQHCNKKLSIEKY